MTDQEINQAVAEACGWDCDSDGYWSHHNAEMRNRLRLPSGCPPSFTSDLNAIQAAALSKSEKTQRDFAACLNGVAYRRSKMMHQLMAADWCEAFLIEAGKWREQP